MKKTVTEVQERRYVAPDIEEFQIEMKYAVMSGGGGMDDPEPEDPD